MYLFADTFMRKGDKALIPAPTFGEYESAIRKTGEIPLFVGLDNDFNIDLTAFSKGNARAQRSFSYVTLITQQVC